MADTTPDSTSPPPLDEFHAAMAKVGAVALWEWNDARSNETRQSEPAHHWRWPEVEPLIDHAISATDTESSERRVVNLRNPALPTGYVGVTVNINCGFQILMPGEKARPHRHNMNALRFMVEGEGAATIVDGKHCPMAPGDLILTPAYTWHEHVHEGSDDRVVWMDSLDAPLVRHLRCVHFEPGPARDVPALPPDDAFAGAGLAPAELASTGYSPIFRYPWTEAAAALERVPAAADGSRTLRYVNPANGGAVMSLMDCYLLGLPAGVQTRARRSTANAAFLVVEGEGVSTVEDKTFAWGRNDVFSVPAWQWVAHKAAAPGARLFQVTDREVLRRLDLLREETAQ